MKLTPKDTVGLLLVVGTLSALYVHIGPEGHAAKHPSTVPDAGGSITTAVGSNTVAFVNVNVLPMDRDRARVLHNQVVIVEGDFVRSISPVEGFDLPNDVLIIKGGGTKYLVPGLTDAHVHLEEGAEQLLKLFVAKGVTTVFNLEGEQRHLDLRERIFSGEVVGPTVYTSGPFTNEPRIGTPQEAEAAVRQQALLGYDFVKIHGNISADAYRRMIDVGEEVGIPIVGHAPKNLSLSHVLGGQVSIVHAEELIYTGFPMLEESNLEVVASQIAAAGMWVTTTVSTLENNETQWGTIDGLEERLASRAASYIPQSLRDRWAAPNNYTDNYASERPQIGRMLDFLQPMLRALGDADVLMLAGSDAGKPVMVPGFALIEEIEALADAGLTSFDVLTAATSNAGRFVREFVDANASFGTVTRNARADLILLDGNPVVDLSQLETPSGVMLRGKWYDRDALDRMLAEVELSR
jgi:hypothetical protein